MRCKVNVIRKIWLFMILSLLFIFSFGITGSAADQTLELTVGRPVAVSLVRNTPVKFIFPVEYAGMGFRVKITAEDGVHSRWMKNGSLTVWNELNGNGTYEQTVYPEDYYVGYNYSFYLGNLYENDTLFATVELEDITSYAESIICNDFSVRMFDEKELSYYVAPAGCIYQLNGMISDDTIAAFDRDGRIMGNEMGTTTLTLQDAISGVRKEVNLTVTAPAEIAAGNMTIYPKEEKELDYTVNKWVNYQPEITFRSSDTSVATIDAYGIVTGKKAGTATITITDIVSGISKNIIVTVKIPTTISASKLTLTEGDIKAINFSISPAKYQTSITFKSSKSSVAKVDRFGNVTGVKAGTAKITLTDTYGAKKTITVTVKKNTAKVSPKADFRYVKEDKSKVYTDYQTCTAKVYFQKVSLKSNSSVAQAINKAINKEADKFLKSSNVSSLYDYAESYSENSYGYGDMEYYYYADSKVTYNKNNVLSIRIETHWFAGGVSNTDVYGMTFNLKNGKRMYLTDVCTGTAASIKQAVKKAVYAKYKTPNWKKFSNLSAKKFSFYLSKGKKANVTFAPYKLMDGGYYTECTIKSKFS